MAVAITALEQDTWPPRVLVTVTGLTIGDGVALYRVVDGVRALVRAATTDAVADTSFLRTDAEIPFGVPVSYLAVINDNDEYPTTPATYALAGGKVAVTDAINGSAAEVVILAWDEKTYQRRASVFRVGGRSVVVSGDLGMFEGSVELFTETDSARDALTNVLRDATEGVVQIRQPGGYAGVDSFVSVLGVSERRWSQDGSDERRVVALQVAEVEAWPHALEARGFTYADLEAAYGGPVVLNANPLFEVNASNWFQSGGVITRSTAQAHEGVASGLLTPGGVASDPSIGSELVPVITGRNYLSQAWVRCAVARTVQVGFNWYNAASAFLSSNVSAVAVAANTWTLLSYKAPAPATSAFGQVKFVLPGVAPNTNLLYIDEALIASVPSYKDLEADYATYLDLAQADLS